MKATIDISVSRERNNAVYLQWVYHLEILVSALFFAVSALLAKFTQRDEVSASMITFLRFAIGLAVLLIYMAATRTKMAPRNPILLISRGVLGLISTYFFYYSLEYTTITNANLLNMTYPLFVAMMAPVFLHQYLKLRDWGILAMAGVGIWFVVDPNFQHVNIGDLFGLGAGFTGGFTIVTLCLARKTNHTITILFFMFAVGTLLSWPVVLTENFSRYTWKTWLILLGCGVTGAIAQFTLTSGVKYLSAVARSVLGMSRVVIAAILGFLFLAEIPTWNVVVGSIVLFFALAWLALPRKA